MYSFCRTVGPFVETPVGPPLGPPLGPLVGPCSTTVSSLQGPTGVSTGGPTWSYRGSYSVLQGPIPQGFNESYIPGWDAECCDLLHNHQQASSREEEDATASALLQKLDATRKARWTESVKSLDFIHSSCKAWQTNNQLTGRKTSPPTCPVTADAIAFQLRLLPQEWPVPCSR